MRMQHFPHVASLRGLAFWRYARGVDDKHDKLMVRFGHHLKAQRNKHGWTQDQLAAKADLSVDMISRLEAGKTGARFPTIEKLAGALKVDPAELFGVDMTTSRLSSPRLQVVLGQLVRLSAKDLAWVENVLDAVLKPR